MKREVLRVTQSLVLARHALEEALRRLDAVDARIPTLRYRREREEVTAASKAVRERIAGVDEDVKDMISALDAVKVWMP